MSACPLVARAHGCPGLADKAFSDAARAPGGSPASRRTRATSIHASGILARLLLEKRGPLGGVARRRQEAALGPQGIQVVGVRQERRVHELPRLVRLAPEHQHVGQLRAGAHVVGARLLHGDAQLAFGLVEAVHVLQQGAIAEPHARSIGIERRATGRRLSRRATGGPRDRPCWRGRTGRRDCPRPLPRWPPSPPRPAPGRPPGRRPRPGSARRAAPACAGPAAPADRGSRFRRRRPRHSRGFAGALPAPARSRTAGPIRRPAPSSRSRPEGRPSSAPRAPPPEAPVSWVSRGSSARL